MICPQCNNNVREGLKFCPGCGYPLGKEPAEAGIEVKAKPKPDKNWVLFGGVILAGLAAVGVFQAYGYYQFRHAKNLAEMYSDLGQYRKCAAQYRIIVNHVPKDVEARLHVADCLMLAGDYKKAIEELEEALEWRRQREDVLSAMGRSYYETKQYRKAEKVLRDALKTQPGNRNAHLYLGLTLETLAEKDDLAIANLNDAADGANKKERALINQHLGNLYQRNQRYDDAVKAYKAVLEEDINNFAATLALARAYLAKDDFRNALVQADRAVRLRPTSKVALQFADRVQEKNQQKLEVAYLAMRIPIDQAYIDLYNDLRTFINNMNSDPNKFLGKKSPAADALQLRATDLLKKYEALEPPQSRFEQNAQYKANAALMRQAVDMLKSYVETGNPDILTQLSPIINSIDLQNQRMSEMLEAEKRRYLGTESAAPATGTQQ